VTEYDHPVLGRVRQFGNLMTFSDTPGRQDRPTPMVGEHTREILGELGYDDAAMDDLGTRKVVTWPDENYPFPV
jgi:crotonobetainyl-CoA:carnitine CoA-transferase CaiB-like acyl-CoA transferase